MNASIGSVMYMYNVCECSTYNMMASQDTDCSLVTELQYIVEEDCIHYMTHSSHHAHPDTHTYMGYYMYM